MRYNAPEQGNHGDIVAVYYPRKKITRFDKEVSFVIEGNTFTVPSSEVPCEYKWDGVLKTSSHFVDVHISYGDKKLRKLIVEDWNGESLEGREFCFNVEIDENFLIIPLFNLLVSNDGTGLPGELHFFLERLRIPISGPSLPPSGGGLFERSLAVPGTVNPATVRYSVQCENCFECFTFRSYHARLADWEYFYSEKTSQPLVIPADDPLLDFKRPDGESKPEEFMPMEIAEARKKIKSLEEKIPPSEDLDRFRWLAPFRCPHCSHPLIDFRNNLFRKAWEYYVCCLKGYELQKLSSEMLAPPKGKRSGKDGKKKM